MTVAENYEAMVAFYGKTLGLPVDHDWDFGPTNRGTVFTAGAGQVEVLGGLAGYTYAPPQGPWLSMQVDDVDAAFAELKAAGAAIVEEPTTQPWGHRIMKLKDPDGLLIWLFTPVK